VPLRDIGVTAALSADYGVAFAPSSGDGGARNELLAGVLGGLEPRCIGVGDLLGELECAVGLGVGEVDDAM
jgi:hypothetical protein